MHQLMLKSSPDPANNSFALRRASSEEELMAISGRANTKSILQNHASGRKANMHGSLNASGRFATNGLATENRLRSERKSS